MTRNVSLFGIAVALLALWVPDAGAVKRAPNSMCNFQCTTQEECRCPEGPDDVLAGCMCFDKPKQPKKSKTTIPPSTVKRVHPEGFKANPKGPMSVAPIGPRNPVVPFPSIGTRRGR